MRYLFTLTCLLLATAAVADEPDFDFSSLGAKKALRDYKKAVAKDKADAAKLAQKRRDSFVESLERALKQSMQAGNLDEANKIDAAIEALKKGASPANALVESNVGNSTNAIPQYRYLANMPLKVERTTSQGYGGIHKYQAMVGTKVYPDSIWAHPGANSFSSASFDLSRKYKTLTGEVGINSGSTNGSLGRNATPLIFEIKADGKLLWRSGRIIYPSTQAFSVQISNKKKLTLLVMCPGTDDHAQAVWLNPKITKQ